MRPDLIRISTGDPQAGSQGGPKTTPLLVHLVDFSELTQDTKRIYGEAPWGIKSNLGTEKDKSPINTNEYTAADEILITASLFFYCQGRGNEYPFITAALTGVQMRQIEKDEWVSGHFLNMMKSFYMNIYPNGPTAVAPLTIETALEHCLFYTAAESLQMIRSFIIYVGNLGNSFEACRNALGRKWRNLFDETVDVENSRGLAEWKSKLGPKLQAYVLEQIELSREASKAAQSPDVQSTSSKRSAPFTEYKLTDVLSIYRLIRNLEAHWSSLDQDLRYELVDGVSFSQEQFLLYFTMRFPGLIITLFEYCSLYGVDPIRTNISFKQLSTHSKAGDMERIISHSEFVGGYQMTKRSDSSDDWE